jgi:hypothetical protein
MNCSQCEEEIKRKKPRPGWCVTVGDTLIFFCSKWCLDVWLSKQIQ